VHNSVRAGYCVGAFRKIINIVSFIMQRNETGLVAMQNCMRGFSIWSNNNIGVAFVGEGSPTVSFEEH